jgi:hypothetical protein
MIYVLLWPMSGALPTVSSNQNLAAMGKPADERLPRGWALPEQNPSVVARKANSILKESIAKKADSVPSQ